MTRSEHLHTQIMALVRGERANDVADALIRSIAATEAKDEIDAAIRKENTASGGGTDVVQ